MTPYETITGRIIASLEAGVIPWRKPWKATAHGTSFPHNFDTGRSYRGINSVVLMCAPYQTPSWLTYRQGQEKGFQVRKGEKGWPVVFWKFDREKDPLTGRTRGPMMRQYTVFNLEQMDGVPQELPFGQVIPDFDPIASAESIAQRYLTSANPPSLQFGGDQPCYMPSFDRVQMPHPGTFNTPEFYYSTLFHELGHSTGHESRLARDIKNKFGSVGYSDEELCAEFCAAFLSADAGISNEELLVNSTAYVQNWIRVLRNDPKMAVYAAQRAQKATDLILGRAATSEDSGVAA